MHLSMEANNNAQSESSVTESPDSHSATVDFSVPFTTTYLNQLRERHGKPVFPCTKELDDDEVKQTV